MRGWRSVWSHDFGVIADFWHDNRCNIFCAEQRGQNNSDGDYMTFGLKERYDCRKWIEWVNEHTEEQLPIYLAGVSMGASTVLMASGLELPSNVRGIVADCGFTSPDAIWKKVVEKNFHLPYAGMRSAVADDMCKKKIHEGTKSYSTINAMKKSNISVLFIQEAVAGMLTGSIGYTHELTEYVIEQSQNSAAVLAQKADPTTDIFTGLPFKETTDSI